MSAYHVDASLLPAVPLDAVPIFCEACFWKLEGRGLQCTVAEARGMRARSREGLLRAKEQSLPSLGSDRKVDQEGIEADA